MERTQRIADFIAGVSYADLPTPVREAAKRIILDTVGCALGALSTDMGLVVRRLVEMEGGSPQATVIGTGQRTSARMAAYANARLANILDYDDTFMLQSHHAHCALAAALAACEWAGLDGKGLITAFAAGFEVGARVGHYLSPRHVLDDAGKVIGWTAPVGPVMGVYAACAASAHALGLPADKVQHALGLAASYLPLKTPWKRGRSLPTIKYEDSGWTAHSGLFATLQARHGITGISAIFAGDDGLNHLVQPAHRPNPAALDADLGQHWWVTQTSFKFWPCCRWLHYSLTAFDQLLREEQVRADEIESVRFYTFAQGCNSPCFQNQDPGLNPVDLEFSYPHAAAMLALGVPPGVDWFNPAVVQSEAAAAFRHKVFVDVEPRSEEPEAWGLTEGVIRIPSQVEVEARGRLLTRRSDFAWGDPYPGAPAFGDEDLLQKFEGMGASLCPLSSQWRRQVAVVGSRILRLEDESSPGDIMFALNPAHWLHDQQ